MKICVYANVVKDAQDSMLGAKGCTRRKVRNRRMGSPWLFGLHRSDLDLSDRNSQQKNIVDLSPEIRQRTILPEF
jgi:hypothetical protein